MWRRYEAESGGFGLRFVALDAHTQDHLTRFVEANETAVPATA